MSIFLTLIGLTIIVIIHELGHFWAAIHSGIGVHEFSIGMGPKVFGKRIKETDYNFRLLPIGGYVKLAGMDDKDQENTPPELNYYNKPIKNKMLVIAAGSLMNIIFGFLIYFLLFSANGVPSSTTTIDKILPNSPAQEAGILSGDTILKIDDKKIENTESAIKIISQSANQNLILTVLRDNNQLSFNIVPSEKNKKGIIGVQFLTQLERKSISDAFTTSITSTKNNVALVFQSFQMLFSGKASLNDMAGPIGIVQFASFELERSPINFFFILAMISISLGVINLFPIPVLDGGYLILLSIEAITKKTISKKWETIIFNIGAILLISLMLFLVSNDLFQWKDRISLLNSIKE